MKIRDAIVAGMKRKKVSQVELAGLLGTSRQRISKIVRGEQEPGGATLLEIIKILEIQKELGLLVESEESELEKQVQILQSAVLELQDKVRKIENKR